MSHKRPVHEKSFICAYFCQPELQAPFSQGNWACWLYQHWGQPTCSISTLAPHYIFGYWTCESLDPWPRWDPIPRRKMWPPASDLALLHCNVLPFDLIFLSYVMITSYLTLITTVWFHLFHTTDLNSLQNRP